MRRDDDLLRRRVRSYFETQECLWPPAAPAGFEQTARLSWSLRRQGVTLRGTIDAPIACTAIHHHAPLFHDDPDFNHQGRADSPPREVALVAPLPFSPGGRPPS